MYIKTAEFHNFRNYEELFAAFDPHVNILTGRNAQGKTNLIEGLYLASTGRSFRTSRDSDMVRFGEETAFVRVRCEKALIDTKVEIAIDRRSKKFVKKDGKAVRRLSEMLRNIMIVVFSPEDLHIVKDEPEKRRKFMDREISQIFAGYYRSLSRYRKALLQRNRYLKEEMPDPGMLEVWDEELAETGAVIMHARNLFLEEIGIYCGRIHSQITGGAEALTLQYRPNVEVEEDQSSQKEALLSAIREHREIDLKMRTTYAGPHKDDFAFFLGEIDARKFGSQGQQRTCALSLKLASLDFIRKETGEDGILLLDDVMSELDASRREYLIRALRGNQIFITSTEIDDGVLNAYPDAKIFPIENGRIVSCERRKNRGEYI